MTPLRALEWIGVFAVLATVTVVILALFGAALKAVRESGDK